MGDGSRKDWYFGSGVLEGAGPLFFLKIPKRAQPGDDALELIGSFVNKVDYGGLFGAFDKECPEPASEYANMLGLKQLAGLAGEAPEKLWVEEQLAGAQRSFKGLKNFGIAGKSNFPGAPKGEFHIDYKKVKTIDIAFGEGSFVRDLRTGYLKDGLRKIRAKPDDYSTGFFDDDMMLVERILVAVDLEISVNMRETFDAGVEADLAAESAAHAGINYKSISKETIVLEMTDSTPYLFGISALRPTKIKLK
jgi:hypothetical protein